VFWKHGAVDFLGSKPAGTPYHDSAVFLIPFQDGARIKAELSSHIGGD